MLAQNILEIPLYTLQWIEWESFIFSFFEIINFRVENFVLITLNEQFEINYDESILNV